MIHSPSCKKQRSETGKCVCGHQPEIDRSGIPAGVPNGEEPIYRLMVKLGKENSLSTYQAIKQMLNEIAQAKAE